MFRSAVGALRRWRHKAGHRAHHQDAPFPAFAHARKDSLSYSNHTEKVRFELPPPVFHAQLFDGTNVNKPRIVDQHVDRARFLIDQGDRSLHGTVIAYVHFQGFERQFLFLCQGIELRALLRRAPRGDYPVASLGEQQRRGLPQSIHRTSNQKRLSSALRVHFASLWRRLSYREFERVAQDVSVSRFRHRARPLSLDRLGLLDYLHCLRSNRNAWVSAHAGRRESLHPSARKKVAARLLGPRLHASSGRPPPPRL